MEARLNMGLSMIQKIKQKITFSVLVIGALSLLAVIWRVQQVSVNDLGNKINRLQSNVEKLSEPKDLLEKLKIEKDIVVIEKDRTTIQNGVYTTLVQALGGLILSVTAYVGYRNLKVAEDKQVTERFSKAIEHLGNDKIDIRLGGIYALEQIMGDSPKYHWTIVEIISAFIRERSPVTNDQDGENKMPGVDIKAAMSILARKKVDNDPPRKSIDLRRANLFGIELEKVANLSQTNLERANLNGASLWEANLEGANLQEADLRKACLVRANLKGVFLGQANLEAANLRGANLGNAIGLTPQQIKDAICDEGVLERLR